MSGVPTTVTRPTVRNTTGEWREERRESLPALIAIICGSNVFIGLLETAGDLHTSPQATGD